MLYFLSDLLVLGCINAVMVVGLNLQYGYTGLLNFAFYTYVAIGAYIAAVTTMGPPSTPGITYMLGWTLPWYVGLLLAGLVSAAFGALVFGFTVRRLRSDYLAIVTVAVAFICWNLINTFTPLFDANTGLFNVPAITGRLTISTEGYSLVVLAIAGIVLGACVWASRRLFRSPFGRLLRACREDEVVTAAFGRPSWQPQLSVFVIGCFMAGIAGGLLVFYLSAWSPDAFLPLESFILLAALIVGGSGNYWGSLLGAFILIEGLNELSRFVPSFGNEADVGALRAVIIGVVLLLMLRYRPEGIIPERWLRWYRTASMSSRPLTAQPAPAGTAWHVGGAAEAARPSRGTIVDIVDVGFAYGASWAVKGCSFTVARGSVTGLIGPNGAGKSTLVEILSGSLAPQQGRVLFEGVGIHGRGPVQTARLGIARTFQTSRVLSRLPVIENVVLAAPDQRGENPARALFWPRGWNAQEVALRREARELLDWLGLGDHVERPAGSLSGGQRRLMEIARALMAHPRLLLLDEPTAGVFPETSRLIAERVREIASGGVTILLIAHNIGFLSAVADDVVVMAEGRVLTRGPLEVVREHEEVITAYLGVTTDAERRIPSGS